MRRGAHFDHALDRAAKALTGRDRRLAHEIAAGCLRERRILDRRISAALTRPGQAIPDSLRDILRIGVYQMIHLDRIPPHAAVDTAVQLARTTAGEQRTGFVNAVLRTVARSPALTGTPTLAEEWSHPDWLVNRWVGRLGITTTRMILEYNNHRPVLRLAVFPENESRLREEFAHQGIEPRILEAGTWEIDSAPVAGLPGYEEGWFFIQDTTQRALLAHSDLPIGSLVWDACAAPGGKATVLQRDFQVVASDLKRARIQRMRANFLRTNHVIPIFAADLAKPPLRAGSMPVVLVDAPCTATGTIARHPDARWRIKPQDIAALSRRQARLLAGAAEVVQPGGRLVYLTCSLEPEENGILVDCFLERSPHYRRAVPDLEILPGSRGSDGGFVAALERVR